VEAARHPRKIAREAASQTQDDPYADRGAGPEKHGSTAKAGERAFSFRRKRARIKAIGRTLAKEGQPDRGEIHSSTMEMLEIRNQFRL